MGTELLDLMIGESDDGDRDHGPDDLTIRCVDRDAP